MRATTEHAEAGTRTRVLRTVLEDGPITAAELAGRLGLTPAAVRRHLESLTDEGLLDEREHVPPGGRRRGRPARAYVLSDAGHATLRGDYDTLAASLLRFLQEQGGDEAVEEFAQRQAETMARHLRLALEGVGDDLADRTQALAQALTRQGYAATTRPVGDGTPLEGIQLCQGHCPVQHVAAEFPQFCEAEARVFSQTLGVHVQRLASLAHGDHVCTTFIPLADLTAAPSSSTHAERNPR